MLKITVSQISKVSEVPTSPTTSEISTTSTSTSETHEECYVHTTATAEQTTTKHTLVCNSYKV
jgi:hypothetical protein